MVNLRCEFCDYTTTHKWNFKRHQQTHGGPYDVYKYDGTECLFCNEKFCNKYVCRRHMVDRCKKNPNNHEIPPNGSETTQNVTPDYPNVVSTYPNVVSTYPNVVSTYPNVVPESISETASYCSESVENGDYICYTCRKTFSTKGNLDRHIRDRCKKCYSDPLQCPKCHMVFTCRQNKHRHTKLCQGMSKDIDTANTLSQSTQQQSNDAPIVMNQQNAETIHNNNNFGIQNNNNMNFFIRGFGKEDLSHITDEVLDKRLHELQWKWNREINSRHPF